jgi:hypothetical protein
MTKRKPPPNATLACKCRVRITAAKRDAFFKDSQAVEHCPTHGTQRITSMDGPERLANMFRIMKDAGF